MTGTASQDVQSADMDGDEALIQRLQSQFGDMDLTHFLEDHGNLSNKSQGASHNQNSDTASEESSLPEPTPEELRAWQEAQFQKGHSKLQKQKLLQMTPLQRRLELRKENAKQKQIFHENYDDDDDWEQLASFPDLQGQTSAFFPSTVRSHFTQEGNDSSWEGHEILGVHPHLQQLSLQGDSEVLGTQWKCLYASEQRGDGLSFFRLLETLRGYPGPTVTLIGCVASSCNGEVSARRQSSTIGFFTTSAWTESADMVGTSDCFLFAFRDDTSSSQGIEFFRPKACKGMEEKRYQYCHPSTMSTRKVHMTSTTNGAVHGIGVGGTPSSPRLHLTETLERCRAMSYCDLFEEGDLLLGHGAESLYYFDVDCLEVWAVGGEGWIQESLQARQGHRDLLDASRLRARRVEKNQFLDDLCNDMYSNSKTGSLFGHMPHTRGRTDV